MLNRRIINLTPEMPVVVKQNKDIIISAVLALYIFSSYLMSGQFTNILNSNALRIFLGLTFFKLITKQTPLRLTSYIFWFFAFVVLSAISFFYALDGNYVISTLYTLAVSFILTFSFIQYVRNSSSIIRILSFYAYLPLFLVIYIFVSGGINTAGERLGQTTFRNANNLALIMMVTLCCLFWFLVYGKRKYWLISAIYSIAVFYILALTGGRKFILVPFIFFFLLLFFKSLREKKFTSILYILLICIIIFASVWAIINIPALYNQIGIRFEGLINFFTGNRADASTVYRFMMISEGWNWFLDQPIFGYGLDNFRVMFSRIVSDASYAHNNFIELLFDLGLIGTIVYYSFYVYIILKLVNIKNDSSGLRDFFLSFMIVLIVYEVGAVTYRSMQIQIFIAISSIYVVLQRKNSIGMFNEQISNSFRLSK